MKYIKFLSCVAAGFALALVSQPATAIAQDEKPIQIESSVLLVQVEQTENGAIKKLVKPQSVVPGDQLAFETKFINSGTEDVTDFVIVNPVPETVILSPKSAAENEVSVDGGKSWGPLVGLTAGQEDGSIRPAIAEDVTHIRWTFPTIQAGESKEANYFASVK